MGEGGLLGVWVRWAAGGHRLHGTLSGGACVTGLRSLLEFRVPQRTERRRNSPLRLLTALLEATLSREPAVFRRNVQEHVMGINKDQVKGRAKEVEGKVQEVAGKMVGSEHQQAKGNARRISVSCRPNLVT